MPTTTTNALDALLYIRNGDLDARWNFPAAIGSPVSNPAGVGTGVELSFSFRTVAPTYLLAAFEPFDTDRQDAARLALSRVAEVADVRFTEVTDGGQITFGHSEQTDSSGFAYYPAWGYSQSGGNITAVSVAEASGDIWIASNLPRDLAYWSPGAWAFKTLLHEIGHALGLKHPFEAVNDGFTLDDALDHRGYTVMSYTEAPNNLVLTVTQTDGRYRSSYQYLQPSTLSVGDMQALQHLYGANTTTRTGDDTYDWETNEELLQTLWDAGGTDTIDASNQVLACDIDLREGAFSSIAMRLTDADKRIGFDLPADYFVTFSSNIYDGCNNLAIAHGAVIENATGGSANDSLTGNDVANRLDGGAGIDTLAGGAGDDTYLVDDAGDRLVETAVDGTDTVFSTAARYVLQRFVENGFVVATGAANLTGNGHANAIEAGAGANVLSGRAGIDTVSYASATRGVTVSLATTAAQDTLGSGIDRVMGFENLIGSNRGDRLGGNAGDNVLDGGRGIDTLSYAHARAGVRVDLELTTAQDTGGAGVDTVLGFEQVVGSAFADVLAGNGGGNLLDGGAGADTLTGGLGDDSYVVDDVGDLVQETADGGVDGVLSLLPVYTLPTQVENGRIGYRGAEPGILVGNDADNVIGAGRGSDILMGGNGVDTLSYAWGSMRGVSLRLDVMAAQATGGSGTDRIAGFENLTGSRFHDRLGGSAAANMIDGGAGNDTLTGGGGRDWLTGGKGNDVFRYEARGDSLAGPAVCDVIRDFTRATTTSAGDRIDLSAIDANAALAGDQAFRFIRGAAFGPDARGQVRYAYDADANMCVVQISTDADRDAEMTIEVAGVAALGAADFLL